MLFLLNYHYKIRSQNVDNVTMYYAVSGEIKIIKPPLSLNLNWPMEFVPCSTISLSSLQKHTNLLKSFRCIIITVKESPSILRFLGFGHYLREWKGFPVLLSSLEQFCDIEVTYLWDCMMWNATLQKCNLFQFTCPYFYKKVALAKDRTRACQSDVDLGNHYTIAAYWVIMQITINF